MSHPLDRLIQATHELKALPTTTGQVLQLMQDTTASADDVLEVISKDPALTANLLKLANSALFGVGRQIGSPHQALVLLGNRTVLSLAFATGMGRVLAGPLAAYRLESRGLWRHSLAVAIGSAHLVEAAARERWLREQAFTVGLVHDIGKLLLNGPLKEQLEPLPPDVEPAVLVEAERGLLGYDHAEAGGRLAENWRFPTGLVQGIAQHHADVIPRTDGETAVLLRAVRAADLIATRAGFGGGSAPIGDVAFAYALEQLGLPVEAAEPLIQRLAEDVAGLESMMGVERAR